MKTLRMIALFGLLAAGVTLVQAGETSPTKMNGKLKVTTLSSEEIRYTGKPYNKDLGAYVFNYRSYDPAISRWTSSDPSGFPDGANGHYYAPIPNKELDPDGMLKVSSLSYTGYIDTIGQPGSSYNWQAYRFTAETDGGAHTIILYYNKTGISDANRNCHGYTFALHFGQGSVFTLSAISTTLSGDWWIPTTNGTTGSTQIDSGFMTDEGFTEITGPDYTGARIALWDSNYGHSAYVRTVDSSGNVTKVNGIPGLAPAPVSNTPSEQWTGTPTYWE